MKALNESIERRDFDVTFPLILLSSASIYLLYCPVLSEEGRGESRQETSSLIQQLFERLHFIRSFVKIAQDFKEF